MPVSSSSSFAVDDKGRKELEVSLARELLLTVLEKGRAFRTGSSSSTSSTEESDSKQPMAELTSRERHVFGVRTYHNWTAGIFAGVGTFAVVFGGLRWHASRRLLKQAAAPSRLLTRPQTNNRFQELEGGKSNTTRPTIYTNQQQSNNSSANSNSFLSDDVVAEIQFMCVGALSIVISSVVARLANDQQQFMMDLGELPLQSGRSGLCYAICPAVSEKLATKMQSMKENGVATDVDATLKDPTTVELESMMRLILNCRTRMDYEREHGGSPASPFNVPEPGVPKRYVALTR